jgi:hypothetical protein
LDLGKGFRRQSQWEMIMVWTRVIATQRKRSGQIKTVFTGRINRTWWLDEMLEQEVESGITSWLLTGLTGYTEMLFVMTTKTMMRQVLFCAWGESSNAHLW